MSFTQSYLILTIIIFANSERLIQESERLIQVSKLSIINNSQNNWKPEKYYLNYFKDFDFSDVNEYLGLIDFSNITLDNNITTYKDTFPSNHTYYNDYDLRKDYKECVSYTKNQLRCGASPAFAMANALSDRICMARNKYSPFIMSVQNLISCDHLSKGCKGMRTENIIYQLIKQGITYNYCQYFKFFIDKSTQKCSNLCDNGSEPQYIKIKKENVFRTKEPDQIKYHIYEFGSVYAEMKVYEDLFYYKEGIYSNIKDFRFVGYHAVRIVGWGKNNTTDYWIVANSWGKDWGDKGFFKIDFESCNISENVLSIIPF